MEFFRLHFYLFVSCLLHAGPLITIAEAVAPVYAMSGEHVFDDRPGEKCVDSDIGANSELPMNGSPYTIEAWVMPDEVMAYESFGIVGWGVPQRNSLNGFIFYRGSHSLRNIWWQNDLQAYLEKPLADGNYHHVAATWDGKMQRIFVDFAEVASKEASGYGVISKANFCVGVAWHQDGTRAKFRGKIKDLRIWNVARGVSEMQANTMLQKDLTADTDQMQVVPATRKYRVHTQRGFLNIHSEPGDPFRTDNVVGRWYQGDVVEVIGKPKETQYGPWLQTSRGWSIQIYADFHWLRPLPIDDETPPKKSAKAGGASKRDDPAESASKAVQGQPKDEVELEGIMSLRVSGYEDLTNYYDALSDGLKTHYGFSKVWIVKITYGHSPSGRQLRIGSHIQAQVHFGARGAHGMDFTLALGTSLKTHIQGALESAGSNMIVQDASVEWKSSPQTGPGSGSPSDDTTVIVMAIVGVIVMVILGSCLALALFRCRTKLTPTEPKEVHSSVQQGVDIRKLDMLSVSKGGCPNGDVSSVVPVKDAGKKKSMEDTASESTAEGEASDGTASMSGETSGEESGPPALYQVPVVVAVSDEPPSV